MLGPTGSSRFQWRALLPNNDLCYIAGRFAISGAFSLTTGMALGTSFATAIAVVATPVAAIAPFSFAWARWCLQTGALVPPGSSFLQMMHLLDASSFSSSPDGSSLVSSGGSNSIVLMGLAMAWNPLMICLRGLHC